MVIEIWMYLSHLDGQYFSDLEEIFSPELGPSSWENDNIVLLILDCVAAKLERFKYLECVKVKSKIL